MSATTIQQYITRWLKGDDTAYRHIFDYYYPRLFPACYRSIRQREDCEEMVLNVFMNIWKHRAQLLQVVDFEKYIFRSLRNQIADFHRRNILLTEDIETCAPEKLGSINHPELSFKELEGIYLNALDKLTEKQREVFLMSRKQGLSQKEIALHHNISVNTVNNHIKAALKLIRNDLGEYSEALPVIILITATSLQ